MKKVSTGLWGVVLIALGVILGLNALGVVDVNIFFPGWWTLFIIVPCFIGLFDGSDRTADLIGLIIGVALLLACQGVLRFDLIWKLFIPVILVIIGLSMLLKDSLKKATKKRVAAIHEKSGKHEQYYATFGSQKLNFAGKDFKGCSLEAIFGGVKCDVRKAKITEDVVIEATSVFGGVTILVPEDVNVEVVSAAMFGGVEDKSKDKRKEVQEDEEGETKKKPTIYIDATCLFGGVEVR